MNVGTVDGGDYLQLKIDGVAFFTHVATIFRESAQYCCDNFHEGTSCSANFYASWPEIGEYYSSSHTASTLTFSIFTSLDENIDNEGYLIRDIRIYLDECHISCSQCNGKNSKNCTACPNGSPVNGVCSCSGSNIIHNHTCVTSCPSQYYFDSTSNSCLGSCVAGTNCQTCSNSSTCTSCTGYGYLYKNSCISKCPGSASLVSGACIDFVDNTSFGDFGS
jgi:hypothetical protein